MTGEQQNRAGELVGLQILRGFAAMLVASHHALEASMVARVGPSSPDWLTTFGASGVDIFFVISGFIMIFVCFRDGRRPPNAGNFLFKRFTRIYPLYWIFCIVLLILGAMHLLRNEAASLSDVFGSLVLLPTATRIMGISWTLSYEMYFYILFSATLVFQSAIRSVAFAIAMIAVIGLVSNLVPIEVYRDFLTDPITFEFCAGLFLGWWYLRSGQSFSLPLIVCVPGIALLAAAPLFVEHQTTGALPGWPRVLTWGLGSLIIVASCLGVRHRGGVQKLFVLLGDASYAIYLTHYFVIGVYARFLRSTRLADFPQPAVIVVVSIACAAVGVGVHLSIERPLLDVIRGGIARRNRNATRGEVQAG